jgi:hypothetical protein
MLKDIILSFKENIKDKTTNPFFGTFLIVGIVRNWDFLITLTNLDLFYTLDKKKEILSPFFQLDSLLWGILTNTWVTVVVIILTYGLLNISRLIVNFFDKVVTPIVYRLTDRGSIVLKTDHKKLKDEKERLEQKLEKERETRLKVQAERDNLEARIIEIIAKGTSMENKEIKEEPKDEVLNNEKAGNKMIESIYSMVASRDMIESFKQTIDSIESRRSLSDNSEFVKYFLRLGLIKKESAYAGGYSTYKFTEKGKELWDFLIEKKEL